MHYYNTERPHQGYRGRKTVDEKAIRLLTARSSGTAAYRLIALR
jgi:hypothetical protein